MVQSTLLSGELSSSPRIVLYSHDTMGLGHIRRNMLIAHAISQMTDDVQILLITGSRESGRYRLPQNTDCVVLPAIHKEASGSYRPKRLDMHYNELINLRSNLLYTTVKQFKPDIFIVDNVPRGIGNELDMTLQYLSSTACHCILGMRDIRDESYKVIDEWRQQEYSLTIDNYYNQVWVYGDQQVFDPISEYQLPKRVVDKLEFTGYLDPSMRPIDDDPFSYLHGLNRNFVLCMVGGGQDGEHLATIFSQLDLPQGLNGVLLTGPYMNSIARHNLFINVERRKRISMIEFVPEPVALISSAKAVIAMGGYNTVTEVLSYNKNALIVPRTNPRKEQIIRAQRMKDLGVLDYLHPDHISKALVTDWLARQVQRETSPRDIFDMGGLDFIQKQIDIILTERVAV